jgi:hypothetical protein
MLHTWENLKKQEDAGLITRVIFENIKHPSAEEFAKMLNVPQNNLPSSPIE